MSKNSDKKGVGVARNAPVYGLQSLRYAPRIYGLQPNARNPST